ncbi:hypothetical protein CGZ96_12030 [Enemella evansiae]|nr:hypothetical protein CGZ96_12030 [Enemella evansiae]OYO06672.1 hypothetical protein CGZ97_05810 [Enemella evansiae]
MGLGHRLELDQGDPCCWRTDGPDKRNRWACRFQEAAPAGANLAPVSLYPVLVAEKLLLLLTDTETGRVRGQFADRALAGALLMDLSFRGRIRVTEKGERSHRPNRVVVVNDAPTDDAVLDAALARLAGAERRMQNAVGRLAGQVRTPLRERLIAAGAAGDRAAKQDLLTTLRQVLLDGAEPDTDTAALIGALAALGRLPGILGERLSREQKRAVRQRASELRQQNWAADAAYRSIVATNAIIAGGA